MKTSGRFRKRPVVIEAVRWDLGENDREVEEFLGQKNYLDAPDVPFEIVGQEADPEIEIATPEGTMTAKPGDWIIKGLEGEVYPCSDSVFRKTYDWAGPLEADWTLVSVHQVGNHSVQIRQPLDSDRGARYGICEVCGLQGPNPDYTSSLVHWAEECDPGAGTSVPEAERP